jgi:hypothetical protein
LVKNKKKSTEHVLTVDAIQVDNQKLTSREHGTLASKREIRFQQMEELLPVLISIDFVIVNLLVRIRVPKEVHALLENAHVIQDFKELTVHHRIDYNFFNLNLLL